MPIDVDSFETISDESRGERRPLTAHADAIESFLADRSDRAFTPSEIQAALEVPRGSVGTALAKLEDRGAVRHRGAYWAAPSEESATGEEREAAE